MFWDCLLHIGQLFNITGTFRNYLFLYRNQSCNAPLGVHILHFKVFKYRLLLGCLRKCILLTVDSLFALCKLTSIVKTVKDWFP